MRHAGKIRIGMTGLLVAATVALGAACTPPPTTPPPTAIAAGAGHTCALVAGGTIKCWGWNISGQLGDGTNTTTNTAVNVLGFP